MAAQFKVFGTAARRDMDNTDTFGGIDIIPRNYFVFNILLRRKLRETGFIMQAGQLGTFENSDHLKFIVPKMFDGVFGEN